jgi:hypothetical protein
LRQSPPPAGLAKRFHLIDANKLKIHFFFALSDDSCFDPVEPVLTVIGQVPQFKQR